MTDDMQQFEKQFKRPTQAEIRRAANAQRNTGFSWVIIDTDLSRLRKDAMKIRNYADGRRQTGQPLEFIQERMRLLDETISEIRAIVDSWSD